MFKLIFFLVGLALAILFSAFNIGNETDISFGFTVFENVPVFLSISISFLAGAVFTLPFAFAVSVSNKKKKKQKEKSGFIPDHGTDEFSPVNSEPDDKDVQ